MITGGRVRAKGAGQFHGGRKHVLRYIMVILYTFVHVNKQVVSAFAFGR